MKDSPDEASVSIRDLLAEAVERLLAAGVDTPRLDAELLLAHALERRRIYLVAHPTAVPTADQARRFRELVLRRASREPLPYLLGAWEFMGMCFRVTPAVLIPRPETETLVEAAAAGLPPDARVLDVGAGSGCVAAGLAGLLPRAVITALERSPDAAAVAEGNVSALGLGERVRVVRGAFPAAALGLGPFDAVVSNPPYIPSAEVDRLAPEQRRHEPRAALDGGTDGMDLIRELVRVSPRLLRPGGLLVLEVMEGQGDSVAALFRDHSAWGEPEARADLAGIPRVLLARTRG